MIGAGGGVGDEEGVRLKIWHCNFRYVRYSHSGILNKH